MSGRRKRAVCQRRTTSLGAAPVERVRVKRTVYVYDTDTWENPVIFGKKAMSESVSRAIDAKIVNGSRVSIESYPEILNILEKFRERVSSKKGIFSTRLLMNAQSGEAWTSPLNIYRGLRQWALKFLPLEKLFGCKRNVERFLRNFKIVLGSGKYSHIRVQTIMSGIDLSPMKWLSGTEDFDARSLASRLVLWMTEDVLWKLVKRMFHVTETTFGRNELFYYRKRKWQSLVCSAVNDHVERGILTPISDDQSCSGDDGGGRTLLANARFLPKPSGVRLITRKRERAPLRDELLLLHWLRKNNHPESVDPKGKMLHKVWTNFASSVAGDLKSGQNKVVYFASVDVRDAFDSVNLDKLNGILEKLKGGLPDTATVTHAMRYGTGGKKSLKEVIVTDAAVDPETKFGSRRIRPRDILDAVMARNKSHAVSLKMGRATRLYKRASGLLQGDPLSSALCNIYLGDLVQTEIRSKLRFVDLEKRLLVRAVDDFLFASLCKEEVRSFLRVMSSGFQEYGCAIKPEKTRTNAVDDREIAEIISFCGALISPRTLETRPDFGSYFGRNIAFASKLNPRDGDALEDFMEKRLNFLVTVNLDRLYQDVTYNSARTTRKNLYECFYVAALRLDSMAATLGTFPNNLKSVVGSCAGAAAARSRVSPSEVSYLMFRAFHAVLRRKTQMYGREQISPLKRMCSGRPDLDELCDDAISERKTDKICSWPVSRLQ